MKLTKGTLIEYEKPYENYRNDIRLEVKLETPIIKFNERTKRSRGSNDKDLFILPGDTIFGDFVWEKKTRLPIFKIKKTKRTLTIHDVKNFIIDSSVYNINKLDNIYGKKNIIINKDIVLSRNRELAVTICRSISVYMAYKYLKYSIGITKLMKMFHRDRSSLYNCIKVYEQALNEPELKKVIEDTMEEVEKYIQQN
jgi:hypothetical protein